MEMSQLADGLGVANRRSKNLRAPAKKKTVSSTKNTKQICGKETAAFLITTRFINCGFAFLSIGVRSRYVSRANHSFGVGRRIDLSQGGSGWRFRRIPCERDADNGDNGKREGESNNEFHRCPSDVDFEIHEPRLVHQVAD